MINRGEYGMKLPNSEVEYRYFQFLCNRGGFTNGFSEIPRGPASCYTYFSLADTLHHIEFKYLIEKDANRDSDGKRLRTYFANWHSNFSNYDIIDKPRSSVLEFIIGFAERIDDEIMRGIDDRDVDRSRCWIWVMLDNLGVSQYDDSNWDAKAYGDVVNKVQMFLNREYDQYGRGGIFPLENSKNDQRMVEIWYQMQEYFIKNYSGINDIFK